VPLETATYISSLVITNPDGSDQKNTADDHIRLIKACLKRTLPLLDGAVSLSHAQMMRLNDVSQSVQFQLNNLRDGSATANNALYANSASFASLATNALNLGSIAAAGYARVDAGNTFLSLQRISNAPADETLRLFGSGHAYVSWYNAGQTLRYGYIQMVAGGNLIIHNEQASGIQLLASGGVTINGGTAWHSGNDGAGSGLDADTIDGYGTNEAAAGSTVAIRTAAGYLFATYLNQSSSETENPNVGSIMVCAPGDNFLRKATPAYLGTQMSARNISNKAGTNKTLSSSTPSGGNDGDIWYQL
jgi:hypothetical protein